MKCKESLKQSQRFKKNNKRGGQDNENKIMPRLTSDESIFYSEFLLHFRGCVQGFGGLRCGLGTAKEKAV